MEAYRRRNPDKPQLNWIAVTNEQMEEMITKIPNGASPGPDGILPCLLKAAKRSVARMLGAIARASLDTGELPDILKEALVSPIHKGGSTSDPAQYRPVCLTSHVGKTMERMVREAMVGHMEVMDKMDKSQHGSRQGRSTLSQLLEHHDEIVKMLETGQNVDVIYLDFAKAFQKCDHGLLLHKLKSLGITGKLARWIGSFLAGRKQRVVVDGQTSTSYTVTSGVPEGTVLGPLLFLIYVHDLGDDITSTKAKYVDDMKVKKAVKKEEDVEELQDDLEKLYCWAENNSMQFNGKKFQVVRYGPNKDIKDETTYFTENTKEVIERFETLRDLGVILSDTGKFEDHVEHVEKKVRQKIGWVLRTFYCRRPEFMKTLWKTLILPHIDYASQLWMPIKSMQIQKVEKLQKDFLRRIPMLRTQNYWQQLNTMKMISIQRRLERYRIIYMWKVLEGSVPNCGVEVKEEGRTGRRVNLPKIETKAAADVKALREQTFQVNGAQLFNSLPVSIRNMTKCPIDDFKEKLDKYLEKVPDEPRMPGLVPGGCTMMAAASNSILDQGRRERRPGL